MIWLFFPSAMAIFENYPYIFDTKIDMYSKIKDTCQKVNHVFMRGGMGWYIPSQHAYLFFQTEVIMNRFINLYEPANCLIQSMENLMENDDQQMYSELMNGLNDGLMRKIYALKVYTLIFNTRYFYFLIPYRCTEGIYQWMEYRFQ